MIRTDLAVAAVVVVVLIALAYGALASPAQGTVCGERGAIVAQLEDRYGETRRSVGLQAGTVVEVYASAETGSWTILRTDTTGKSCLMAAGDAFQPFALMPAEERL